MIDMGHEGATFSATEVHSQACAVYVAWRKELNHRGIEAPVWEQLAAAERARWSEDVHGVMLGGVSVSTIPWVRELVSSVVRRTAREARAAVEVTR